MDFNTIALWLGLLASVIAIISAVIWIVERLQINEIDGKKVQILREKRATLVRFVLVCVCGVATVVVAIYITATTSQIPQPILDSSDPFLVILVRLTWIIAGLALFAILLALRILLASMRSWNLEK